MPSSARRILFPFFGAFRRIRNRFLRADESIGPYIGCVIGSANSYLSRRLFLPIARIHIPFLHFLYHNRIKTDF